MFAMVEAYADLGDHRTGSAVDHATVAWLCDQLAARGLDVATETSPFERWDGTAELMVDGVAIDALAFPDEWSGQIRTDQVAVVDLDPKMGGFAWVIDAPVAQARADGADAVVLVTRHPDGALVAINRSYDKAPAGLPVVLAPGRDLDRLRSGSLRLSMTGAAVPGVVTNIAASNAVEGPPVVLTTPTNGWFGCAGERGTGLAVLFDLIDRLCDHPLQIVLTGGHELGYLGAHRWVDAHPEPPRGIIHVGASIAVDAPDATGGRSLVPARFAMTSLGAESAAVLEPPLGRVGVSLAAATDRWVGEGEALSRFGTPLVSTTGAGVDFHTPGDVADRVTSPESLVAVADAMADMARSFIELTDPASAP